MIVGKAKNDNIVLDNGVYYGQRLGLPWVNSPFKLSPFTWPVMVNGKTLYVDPKNVGIIPWEHEWQSVSGQIFTLAKANQTFDKIKRDFKQKFMRVEDPILQDYVIGNGDSNNVFYPSDPLKPKGDSLVIPRTNPRGTPNEQAKSKSNKLFLIFGVIVAIGILIYFFKKRK